MIDIALTIMRNQRSMIPRVSVVAFLFLSFFPGCILSAFVTLNSVQLYTGHKWIENKSPICFKCSGEDKTTLPDVQKANVSYSFTGEESWQPLTDFQTKKCKRCGIYEDLLGANHIFDEWELCSSDFTAPDGHYTRFKEKQLNATFLCKDCILLTADLPPMKVTAKSDGGKTTHVVTILITVAVALVVIIVSVLVFKCYKRRKRQQQQAKFLKLFEEDDDIEDELGLRELM